MKKIKTFVYSIIGGGSIAIGGAAFLSVESKVVGALFFVVGLFVICTMGFSLFTGKVCYVFENDADYALDLLLIWLGNIIGAFIVGEALRATRIAGISESGRHVPNEARRQFVQYLYTRDFLQHTDISYS